MLTASWLSYNECSCCPRRASGTSGKEAPRAGGHGPGGAGMSQVKSLADVQRVIADYDRAHPRENEYEKHWREAEERKRQAREAEAREQRQASNNWESWSAAIDQRIEQSLVAERDLLIEATGKALGQIRAQLRDEFKCAITEMQRAFETKLAEHKERLLAVPGKLPVSKIWRPESVTYEGEVVSYDGSLYQARKDTAQAPGGTDWICVARAGRDGCDGRTPNVCGTYDVHKKYERLDIVTCDGASFIASYDDPGLCPGDGWQVLASRGKIGDKGQPGPPGKKGERGEAAPTIVSWQLDQERYRAIPFLSDGTPGPELNLRPFFEMYDGETAHLFQGKR